MTSVTVGRGGPLPSAEVVGAAIRQPRGGSGMSFPGSRERVLKGANVPDSLLEILEKYKTLAVVGLSSKCMRPSFGVAGYMQGHGYGIVPVNPHEKSVLGEKAYPSLDDVPGAVEVVVIFRRPEYVPEIVEAAIRKQAKVVWMQEGVRHQGAAQRARAAGLAVVEDRCILKEHARRFVTQRIY